MSRLINNYTNYTTHKIIVDCLEKDGVICSSSSKDYNEQATYEGGSGFRLSFTKYNQKISDYHTILKVLSGEQRADIHEAIPVIDFLDTTNTSLLYTYDVNKENEVEVLDTSSIHSASSDYSTALEQLENDDDFFINRAIMGQPAAEHFYNTTGTASESNIQVSPWLGNNYVEYYYRGTFSKAFYVGSTYIAPSTIKNPMKTLLVSNNTDLASSYVSSETYMQLTADKISTLDELEEEQLKEVGVTIVEYTSEDGTVDCSDNPEYRVDGESFIEQVEGSDGKVYRLNLYSQDICILASKSNTSSDLSKLYVFKYSADSSQHATEALTWGPYSIPDTSENGNILNTYRDVTDCISNLTSATKGQVYYLSQYPEGAIAIDSENDPKVAPAIPSKLIANSEIICNETFNEVQSTPENLWDKKGNNYKVFLFQISTVDCNRSLTETKADEVLPSYLERTGVYDTISKLLDIEKIYIAEASGVLDGLYGEPFERGTSTSIISSEVTKWKFINESDKAKARNTDISIGTKYFKGHLLGRGAFDKSPLKLTKSDRKESSSGYQYKGKFTLAYDTLMSSASALFDKVKVEDFNNFPLKSVDDVVTKADLEGRKYTASEAKDLLGVTDSEMSSKFNYTYSSVLNYPEKFKGLFEGTNVNSNSTQKLYHYFNDIFNDLKEEKDKDGNTYYSLSLDATDSSGPCACSRTSYQTLITTTTMYTMQPNGKKCGKQQYSSKPSTTTSSSTTVSTTGDNLSKIFTEYDKNYAISYGVILETQNVVNNLIDPSKNTNISTNIKRDPNKDIFDVGIRVLTPFEALSTKNTHSASIEALTINSTQNSIVTDELISHETRKLPTGTVLVYPDYNKNLPNTLFLISKDDLKLEAYDDRSGSTNNPGKRSMVSFVAKDSNTKKDSVICFKVSAVKPYKPSLIKKVTLKTEDQTITLDYPKGLYTTNNLTVTSKITGFEKVKVTSSTVTNSQGLSFDLGDIIEGRYLLNQMSIVRKVEYSEAEEIANNANAIRLASVVNEVEEATIEKEKIDLSSEVDTEIGTNKLTAKTDSDKEVISEAKNIQKLKTSGVPSSILVEESSDVIIRKDLSSIDKANVEAYDESNSNVRMSSSKSSSTITKSGAVFLTATSYINYKKKGIISSNFYVYVPIYDYTYVYETKSTDLYDCYIYILEPMQVSLDTIDLYDQKDNRISFEDYGNLDITPMAYPSSFFATSIAKDTDNSIIRILKDRKDVNSLKDRLIIPGLPKFTTREDFLQANTRNLPLTPLVEMIFNKESAVNLSIGSILSGACYNLFKNFKLSGLSDNYGNVNPFLMEDLPSLVDGLVSMKPTLYRLFKSNFLIPSTLGYSTVTLNDLEGLLNRIDKEDTYANYTYEVTNPSSSENPNLLSEDGFAKELQKQLNSITFKVATKDSAKRASLRKLKEIVNRALVSPSALNREVCEAVDSYLGNNTAPFINIGQTLKIQDVRTNTAAEGDEVVVDELQATDSLYQTAAPLDLVIRNTILNLAIEAKKAWLVSQGKEDPSIKLKKIYKQYYTDASVESVFGTSLDYVNLNDSKELEFNFNNQDLATLRNCLRQVKVNGEETAYDFFSNLLGSSQGFEEWVSTYKLNVSDTEAKNMYDRGEIDYDTYLQRSYAVASLRDKVQEYTLSQATDLMTSEDYNFPTISMVEEYYESANENNSEGSNVFFNSLGTQEMEDDVVALQAIITVILPNYDPSTNTFEARDYKDATDKTKRGTITDPNYNYARIPLTLYSESKADIDLSTLNAISSFVRSSLEGTGTDNYYVKYIKGDDSPSGRKNSLYYRRYLMLNNRMNTAEGTLANLMILLRNNNYSQKQQQYADNLNESYGKFLSVVPVSKMEPLTWMPEQEATATTVHIPGKLYYQAELDALRSEISSQCILTCTRCTVQKSCPFYNEEEIIKLYCTPAETLDLYLKDNELDLIAYTEETTENDLLEKVTTQYPYVVSEDSDGQTTTLDIEELKNKHLFYRDVVRKLSGSKKESYEGQDLQLLRQELRKAPDFNDAIDGESMGFLLGGRYGTVRKNDMAALANKDEDFKEFNGVHIPEYQYLYDAVYIKDTESYFTYGVAPETYNVAFDVGPKSNKKKYVGKVKLKTPLSLKAFSASNPNDHVYLVSDDTADESGNKIVPVIYLGQLKNLSWNFGIISDPSKSVQTAEDKNIYLSDVAQWCINYYKGHCTEDPIGDVGADPSSPTKETEEDRDQYWMTEIKKKVFIKNSDTDEPSEKWITLEGRPRESIGYQEPVMDPDNLDEVTVAAGKPVVLDYINFIRKFSIRIYDASAATFDEAGNYNEANAWKIPWVKDVGINGSKTLSDGSIITWNTQRAALAYMKTNLRLAIVKDI